MAFQSLYRRFRPQRFSEVKGQPHLVNALQNAVREDRVGHAYLLSGPRGTGKTSTARLLAKALNCENLGSDGEPCTSCNSCLSIEAGNSMDVFELDAASNRKLEDIHGLIRGVALGNPGRRKVYILDEVHMLTKEASNALLKTLEEPPAHVVFVLATTDPQKVLPTIRSRTQHIELSLVGAELMAEHVRDIAGRADLDIDDVIVEHVVHRGSGSVRDTLSALDQVLAAGGVAEDHLSVESIVGALGQRDVKAGLSSVAVAVEAGADPRDLTERLTRHLRDMFLVITDAAPGQLSADMAAALAAEGQSLGAVAIVRALEQFGSALVDMRQAADARLVLELAIVRLTSAQVSTSPEDLIARVAALEAQVARLGSGESPAAPAPNKAPVTPGPPTPAQVNPLVAPTPKSPAPAPPGRPAASEPKPPPPAPTAPGSGKAAGAREALASAPNVDAPVTPPPVAAPPPAPTGTMSAAQATADLSGATHKPDTKSVPSDSSTLPDLAQVSAAWSDHIIGQFTPRIRNRFQLGEFSSVVGDVLTYLVPSDLYRDRCAEVSAEVASTISEHFGTPVRLEIAVGDVQSAPDQHDPAAGYDPSPVEHSIEAEMTTSEVRELADAPTGAQSGVDRITAAFPGASVVDGDDTA